VTIQLNTEAHGLIRRSSPRRAARRMTLGADVVEQSFVLHQRLRGAAVSPLLRDEIPYFHGQAFPGMIHLSFMTFLGLRSGGEDESFRAHEMAHQWWGIGVEPASYRDAWLSEGFAEFAGMWYMQMILHDNDKYFKCFASRATRSAGRGTRRSRSAWATERWKTGAGNYALITYQKGAWYCTCCAT